MKFGLIAFLLVATPLAAQEPDRPSPLSAGAWCIVRTTDTDSDQPGCDIGAGLALERWRKLSWVAVLGAETLGTGLAWVPSRDGGGPVIAVAIGLVVRYDTTGIDGSQAYPAIGCTLSFMRSQESQE
jgi:hypothetical protein